MAFTPGTLRRMGSFSPTVDGAAVPGLYTYITADATATVTTSGYMDSIYTQLAVGAVIIVVSSFGGTEVVNLRVVQSITAGVVVLT